LVTLKPHLANKMLTVLGYYLRVDRVQMVSDSMPETSEICDSDEYLLWDSVIRSPARY
jgi:hypothetical protein